MNTSTAAKTIGWLGIGLGTVELVVPGWLQRQLGADSYGRLMRIFGVREMLAGVGIGGSNADAMAWSRMAAETIDLMALANAAQRRMQEGRIGTTLIALGALTALDALVARGRLQEDAPRLTQKPRAEKAARPRQATRRSTAKVSQSTH